LTTGFTGQVLDEPDLVFGSGGEEKDPRLGLRQFGPFFTDKERAPTPSQVRLGIIGTDVTTELTKRVINLLGSRIESRHFNRWAHPDFDGFSIEAPVRCTFVTSDLWSSPILPQEIDRVIRTVKVNDRIAAAVDLLVGKVAAIASEESPPDVIVIALPQMIVNHCGIGDRTTGAKRPKFTQLEKLIAEMQEKHQTFLDEWGLEILHEGSEGDEGEPDYDLRNAIKGQVMRYGIPVQLLKEESSRKFLDGSGEKDGSLIRASFAWNLSTGMYYKAKGRPWRLAKLTQGSCYVGISFFRDLRTPQLNLQTSMAQLFTHSGDGFVLRGSEVVVDPGTKEAHLKEDQADQLLRSVLDVYDRKVGTRPARVVLHKTSGYSEGELAGFKRAIGNTPYDLVTISSDAPFRMLRLGEYPVLRGTVIGIADQSFLLYSTGYIPRIRTYPGRRVPAPLFVTHAGASDRELIARELLGLTKLNWNTTVFSTRLPITLEFARQVGKVLSELGSGVSVQDHYRFYM
jgi:hypothetical protein